MQVFDDSSVQLAGKTRSAGASFCEDKKLISRLFLAVISIALFGGKSEPTALAAGLEVERFDLQTVSPMLMFLD